MLNTLFKSFLYSIFILLILIVAVVLYMTWMPSPAYDDSIKTDGAELQTLQNNLKRHVQQLSKSPLGRNIIVQDTLSPARDYIAAQFNRLKLKSRYHTYELYGDVFTNISVDIAGTASQQDVLIIAAHYDSVERSPGANDNASGVAALIEIGRYLGKTPPAKPVRLIAFANEEPPYFQTDEMGSLVYAKSLPDKNETIAGMISLETIGYYTKRKGSQKYPGPLNLIYPDTGNFVSFVGNLQSRSFLTSAISQFRQHSNVPSEGVAAPAIIPGVAWSDHWSFWVTGHNAIMITDTAPYRYEHYHKDSDTPDKLNYEQFANVVYALGKMTTGLANKTL